jgi:hypothetical protein
MTGEKRISLLPGALSIPPAIDLKKVILSNKNTELAKSTPDSIT